jgi:hypothetical protein
MPEDSDLFPTSNSLVVFQQPIHHSLIAIEEILLEFSESVFLQLRNHWFIQLRKKQLQLLQQEITSEIRGYDKGHPEGLLALFAGEKCLMWPGKCVTLLHWKYDTDGLKLTVGEITYPFIAALGDEEFQKSVADQNLKAIRPPLAVCTFAITTDRMLVLTVRGKTTNVYPGRFYGQGGNPTTAHFSLLQHQLDELNDELLLAPDEVIHDSLQFNGIIEDCEAFPRKPDLIGTVQLKLSSQELADRFYSRPSHQRPTDVADIRLIPFNANALRDFLDSETQPTDFCPPARGGMRLISQFHFGK